MICMKIDYFVSAFKECNAMISISKLCSVIWRYWKSEFKRIKSIFSSGHDVVVTTTSLGEWQVSLLANLILQFPTPDDTSCSTKVKLLGVSVLSIKSVMSMSIQVCLSSQVTRKGCPSCSTGGVPKFSHVTLPSSHVIDEGNLNRETFLSKARSMLLTNTRMDA